MSDLVNKAQAYAAYHHGLIDQRRKYTNDPYIVHPARVVDLVKQVKHTDEMLAAAWLHDVVEDTSVTLNDIEEHFGKKVASLVEMLTDVSKPTDGNRKIRKAIDKEHLSKASPDAMTIKLADLIDNSNSIIDHDPDFAKIYLKKIAILMDILVWGDSILYNMVMDILEDNIELLK